MLIIVDPHSGVPVYRQIMDQVKLQVSGGVLKPGSELPSTRALSSELGINPMTISKAYSLLERDNVVERRPGRPLVVREFDATESRDRRTEQLREALLPTVTVVRQLGVENGEAVALFRELLEGETGSPETNASTDKGVPS